MTAAPGDVETRTHSVADLRERMADLCAGAVDALEVTAGLEAEGINDEAARGYGHPDVFALAEDLYTSTPRRPPEGETPEAPWRAVPWRHLLRGVLFGLPGLCYVVGAPVLTRTGAGVLLVLSLVLAWTVSQGTAYLGYVRLGYGKRDAASLVLRYGLGAGLLLVVPVTVAAGALMDAGAMATAMSAGLGCYLLSATVVQVHGGEVRLFLALLPGVGAAAVHLAGHRDGPPQSVPAAVWAAWGVSLAATTGLALLATRRPRGPARERGPAAAAVGRRDLWAALPFSLFGLLTGGLLTYTLLSALAGRPVPAGTTTVAVLSLSLSMGGAEWILYAYRRRVHDLLRTHTAMDAFTRAARAALGGALARYAASLLGLVAAAGVLARLPATGVNLRTLGGFAELGCAFFLALILQACARVGVVLALYTCALAAEAGAALAVPHVAPGTVQLVIAGVLLAALSAYAARVLARATSHR
ncbi:hypothetical protein [Actinomadura chibensis]|uniref:Uncharacterized protein n=1 Tax=Actinomadura chibensis TaxID=392828 RepID=A0A5D0NM36_9ACTN|nr:hypothetical protein [Actinomadura chibensis]TYB45359.1 hypothetical protein FXF69_18090 [Actinomadura chibensis]